MLNSGKKFQALRDKKNKYSNSRVARKKNSERNVINDYTSRTQGCGTSMLTSLEWQTLEQQRRISRLVMMYKIQHQLVDIDRDLYLRPGDSRTRGQHRFFQERANYDTLRNSFQRTAREWNHLPDYTVGASSIEESRANLQQQVSHANQCK